MTSLTTILNHLATKYNDSDIKIAAEFAQTLEARLMFLTVGHQYAMKMLEASQPFRPLRGLQLGRALIREVDKYAQSSNSDSVGTIDTGPSRA